MEDRGQVTGIENIDGTGVAIIFCVTSLLTGCWLCSRRLLSVSCIRVLRLSQSAHDWLDTRLLLLLAGPL